MTKIKGWTGFIENDGKFVRYEDGFDYAANECGIVMHDLTAPLAGEFRGMLVEWFFSGNWIEVWEDDCDG